jgi:hypothetical protein
VLFWLFVALVAVTLRLLWPSDMEWKADEKNMYELAAKADKTSEWPSTGLSSGVGVKNAGFSVWPFIVIHKLNSNPVFMAIAVMLANVLALIWMFKLALKSGRDSQALMWGVALVGANVLNVIFSRKIWAQDLLPLLIAGLWAVQFMRSKTQGFAITGFLIAIAGQLHISGYFIGAGIMITAWLSGENNLKKSSVFILGFAIGMLPAYWWLYELISNTQTSNVHASHIFKFEYFLHAISDPLGFNVFYSLGHMDTIEFAKFKLYSTPTFVPLICSICIVALTLVVLIKTRWNQVLNTLLHWRQSPLLKNLCAFVLIPGFLLTLSGSPIRSHYLIGAAPFLHASLASLLLKNYRKGVFLIWILQSIITACFLWYIHTHTTISGDYGTPFSQQ